MTWLLALWCIAITWCFQFSSGSPEYWFRVALSTWLFQKCAVVVQSFHQSNWNCWSSTAFKRPTFFSDITQLPWAPRSAVGVRVHSLPVRVAGRQQLFVICRCFQMRHRSYFEEDTGRTKDDQQVVYGKCTVCNKQDISSRQSLTSICIVFSGHQFTEPERIKDRLQPGIW